MPMKPKVRCDRCGRTTCGCRQRARRQADRERPNAARRGYGRRWREYVSRYRRDHPLCVLCLAEEHLEPTACVDHIVPVSGPDDPLFWDEANHEALCRTCHARKTAREDGGFGNRAISQEMAAFPGSPGDHPPRGGG